MTILKHNKPVKTKENSLWKFSLEFYSKEENKTACLYLQNHYGLNINLILALIWHAAIGKGVCSISVVLELISRIDSCNQLITEELRKLRNFVDQTHSDIYNLILDIEIFSEKMQQSIIYDFFIIDKKTSVSAEKKAKQGIQNLQTYFSVCKVNLSEEAYGYTRQLLANAFTAFKEHDFPQMQLDI